VLKAGHGIENLLMTPLCRSRILKFANY